MVPTGLPAPNNSRRPSDLEDAQSTTPGQWGVAQPPAWRKGPTGVSISYFPARLAAYSGQGPWAMLRLSAGIARGFSGYTPGRC